jgi:hypothetical protein
MREPLHFTPPSSLQVSRLKHQKTVVEPLSGVREALDLIPSSAEF